jgi:hypothetical protein
LQNYIKHLKKGTERVQIKSAKSKKSFWVVSWLFSDLSLPM